MSLSKFHIDTLSFIVNQHQDFKILLQQIPYLKVSRIEHTRVGCFYRYELNSSFKLNTLINIDNEAILGTCCQLESDFLNNGASLILWINNKKIETLEVFANGGEFPIEELSSYSLICVPVNIIDDAQSEQ